MKFVSTTLIFMSLLIFACTPAKKNNTMTKSGLVDRQRPIALSFAVCEVERADIRLAAAPYREVIIEKVVKEPNWKERETAINLDTSLSREQRFQLMEDLTYQPKGIAKRSLEASAESLDSLIMSPLHPFMGAMHTAYAKHYPLTISPDMIWLLIAQGFAIHVNQQAEEMREYFVDFEGKKNIGIRRDNFVKGGKNNDWPNVFPEFSEKIGQNTSPELAELVAGEFSTTNPTEQIAFQITLMDAMKSYFQYSMTTLCGIPEITLEGSPADWRSLEQKTRQLAKYELDWWIKELQPLLKEFTKAAEGKADSDFWQSIYKHTNPGSGDAYITGWILNFFPYLKDYQGTYLKNPAIGNDLATLLGKENSKEEEKTFPRITTKVFPSGLSQADFLWQYFSEAFKMEFVAGFVGFKQDATTLALRPEISWAVVDKGIPPTPEELEIYEKGGDKKYLKAKKKQ